MRRPTVLAALFACGCATPTEFHGPLPVRNQHPAQLQVLHMNPASARAMPAGGVKVRTDAAYTSLFLGGSANGDAFLMDGEILRVGVETRVGLGHGFELRAEVPVGHTSGGFLDSFVVDFHDLFGAPGQGRASAPKNEFEVYARNNGSTAFEMREESVRLFDIPTELSWTALPPTATLPLSLALRGAVEWPTGDEERGFGNGEIDFGVGATVELRQPTFALTAQAQHTFVGNPDRAEAANLEFADVTAVAAGLELPLSDDVAVLLQTEWETSTLRHLRLDRANDPQWLLWTGLRTRLSGRSWCEFAFAEDLASFVSPDFSAYFGLSLQFGAP